MTYCHVSIIVPVYNLPENLISRCLSTVEKQLDTWPSVEVIVVDDGSDSASSLALEKIVLKFKKLDCQIVTNGTNLGLAEARWIGVRNSGGNYCFFLDGDDTLPTGAVAALAQKVSSVQQQDVIDGQIMRFGPAGPGTPHRRILTCELEQALIASLGCQTSHMMQGSLYKKSLLSEETMRVSHTYPHEDLTTRTRILARARSIGFVDTPVYEYRLRHSSLSSRIQLDSLRGHLEAFSDWIRLIRNELVSPNYLPIVEAGLLRKVSWFSKNFFVGHRISPESVSDVLQILQAYRRQLEPLDIDSAIRRVIEQSESNHIRRNEPGITRVMRSVSDTILKNLGLKRKQT